MSWMPSSIQRVWSTREIAYLCFVTGYGLLYIFMDYNTELPALVYPEYGRHVQRMVELTLAEPSRETRTRMAQAIVDYMGQLNPQLRDNPEYKHKLWDHLHILAHFKLDADCPYPAPSPESLVAKPEPMNYPKGDIRYRHYGKIMERLIHRAVELDDANRKTAMVDVVANLMKKYYLAWNRDSVMDETIFEQLGILSKGELKAEENKRLNFIDFRNKNHVNFNNHNTPSHTPLNPNQGKRNRHKKRKY